MSGDVSSEDETKAPPPSGKRRVLMRLVLMVALPAICILGGLTYYYAGGRYVTTENAYVKAPITSVIAQISGRVKRIYVKENEIIAPGQKLLELEQDEFALSVEEAKANLAAVVQDIDNRRAELRQVRAEIKVSHERQRYLKSQLKREEELTAKGIGLRTKLDEAQHLLLAAGRNLAMVQERENGVLASLGGDPAISTEAHPKYLAAKARLNRAHLDLQRSALISPAGGVVAKMNLEVGEYIKSGDPLFAIVQADKAYIEVNLKETELTHVRMGQKATFVAETYPDLEWTAEVIGISPATGAEFAVLPPQNASGNWVKVVQRLPVRLAIKPGQALENPPLRAGMSVLVSIDTGHQRHAPPLVSQVLAATRTIVGTPKKQ
ncbi:MAG: HlyD family secretion protein [Alphaproteobacteria bacterium]|nr:HlyD family secretion protein [Alphaproteobacteria bacterium]